METLQHWIAAVEAGDPPHLYSFTRGIRREMDAVINGLTHAVGATLCSLLAELGEDAPQRQLVCGRQATHSGVASSTVQPSVCAALK